MKPVTPFDNFPSFGNAGARQAPGDAKYALGFVAADTLPAEWANYFFHGSTKGISDLNTAVRSIWLELSTILTAYNITADASETNQLYTAIEKRISSLYPVGTIYQNADNATDPGTLLGFGTWTQITDKFLAARGSTNIGASGGQWTVTLSANNIPRHRHVVGDHKHYMDHKHWSDIMHGHTVNDPSHKHKFYGNRVGESYGLVNNGYYTQEAVISLYENWTELAKSNVTVNAIGENERYRLSSDARYINNTDANRAFTDIQCTTDAQSSTIYTDYQYAENPTAISITPTYVGVYTWKRTA